MAEAADSFPVEVAMVAPRAGTWRAWATTSADAAHKRWTCRRQRWGWRHIVSLQNASQSANIDENGSGFGSVPMTRLRPLVTDGGTTAKRMRVLGNVDKGITRCMDRFRGVFLGQVPCGAPTADVLGMMGDVSIASEPLDRGP
jgi:hypothetical protein